MTNPLPTGIDRKARLKLSPVPVPLRSPAERRGDFAEIRIPYTPLEAQTEAARCLHCPTAPCQAACPMHNAIPEALGLIEAGDFVGAGQIYARTNLAPEICGRTCPHQLCEQACVQNPGGRALALRHLEAFAGDALRAAETPTDTVPPVHETSIAVVGSGPAGLSAAETLARHGYPVTIYERQPYPGGLLMYGIPNFKLEKLAVQALVRRLEKLGVTFRCNVTIGKDLSMDDLRAAHQAVFLGTGAGQVQHPGLPHENAPGVYEATEFLARGNIEPGLLPEEWQSPFQPGARVHVLGGGDTAMDCLRTAVRLPGVAEVTCYYRRSEAEMPAHHEDYTYAREEGAQFVWLTTPVNFTVDESGRLTGVIYQKIALGDPDPDGRRHPTPIPDSEFHVPADAVVLALGYSPDPAFLSKIEELKTHSKGLIIVDHQTTGRTTLPDVLAAGDAVRGPDLLAPAIADARRVATALAEKLSA